ncbi:hypothetical protein SAMN05421827_11920 [Pedobacter terrae]|uniref:Uncharacterized protein n=1 Tax=Pedobacter terrae TaxID=405671 RepID=A0A1G8AI34_9SPHI|nr:hypothetical protein [Pedobacter terrae]SDH20665.1 hypothetical protein SAMN05421827_11920 [Pedobacter terrae]
MQSDSPNTGTTSVVPDNQPAAAPSMSPHQVMQQQISDLKSQIATIQQQAIQAMQSQVDSSFQALAASSLQMVNDQAQPQAAAAVTPVAPPLINPIQQAMNTVNTNVDAAMLAAQQSVQNAESIINNPAQQNVGN